MWRHAARRGLLYPSKSLAATFAGTGWLVKNGTARTLFNEPWSSRAADASRDALEASAVA